MFIVGDVAADVAQHLKRLAKREAVTRVKALQASILALYPDQSTLLPCAHGAAARCVSWPEAASACYTIVVQSLKLPTLLQCAGAAGAAAGAGR